MAGGAGSAAFRLPLSVTPSPPNEGFELDAAASSSSAGVGLGFGAFVGSKGTYLYPKKNFPGGRERTAGTERVGSSDKSEGVIIRGFLIGSASGDVFG